MTANVTVEIARASAVLRVPNAALRVRPAPDVLAALERESAAEEESTSGERDPHADVWVLVDGRLSRVPVRVGITDGSRTAVFSRALSEGAAVATSIAADAPVTPATSTSPLLPSFRGRGAGAGRGAGGTRTPGP